MDYMQIGGIHSAIRKPVIAANNFEIKSGTIQMIKSSQFGGLATEDPKEHISNFVELCETFKFNGVTDDTEESPIKAQGLEVLHSAVCFWRHGVREGVVRFRSKHKFDASLNIQEAEVGRGKTYNNYTPNGE